MKRFLLFIISSLTILISYAQDFSNKGKDFWIAYEGHIDGTNSRMALYVTSDVNATGILDVNGVTRPFTVTANQVTTVQLTTATTPSNTNAYNSQIEGIGAKKGVHITTNKPVVVYSHILNSARSGSTLVLPTNVLGREYYVSSYKSVGTQTPRRCEFDVVGTEDNSTVEITPTNSDASNIHPANVPFQIILSKGDVYQYQSNEDLTGSHIRAIGSATGTCQRIAVYSGSTWTAMGCTNATSGDNLYQEMFPYSSWGKTYYTAPFISRSYDIFRILVQDPTVPVFVNGTALNMAGIIGNRFYEINTQGNNTARIITSDKPICVLQYLITQNCDGVNSDPEMIILNSIEQTLNDITVMSARNDLTPPSTNITTHYLNVIYKTANYPSLKIDGNTPVAVPVTIGTTGYSYIQENVTASTLINPSHRVTSDSGFICLAYGYGNVESYGYNAGTNVKDLLNFITPINPLNITNEPSACANTPFYFSVTYPFEPTSLFWDFHGFQTPDVTVSPPVADTTYFVNGKQVWRYKLPTPYVYNPAGSYPVSITAGTSGSDGCGNLQIRDDTLYVFNPPVTNFGTVNNGCVTDSVRFHDSTFYTPGTYSYKWYWDFGDGTYDSAHNPIHKYASPGSYTVKFALISNVGCLSDTATKLITVTLIPQANFGVSTPTCSGMPVTLTDSSIAFLPGALAKWYWDYGDGIRDTVSDNSQRVHTFAPWGNKTVTLRVQTVSGCQSPSFSKTFPVHAIPVPDFTIPAGLCLPNDSAHFFDASSVADNTFPFAYLWNFGDAASGPSNTSTVKDPVHYYNSGGPFTITLHLTTSAGCTHDTMKILSNVYPQTHAVFSVNAETCLHDTTKFTDQTNPAPYNITDWYWDFGDGQTSLLQNPVHVYNASGTYTIHFHIRTDKGCYSDTSSQNIIINPLPTAAFTVSAPLCETRSITFTNSSIANAGNITTWNWDLGDGTLLTLSSGAPFTHVYATSGSYTGSLSVTTNKGCTGPPANRNVLIHPLPVANYILPGVCLSDAFAQFLDSSYIADGTDSSFTYLWNFGDPTSGALNTSTLKNPVHRYLAAASYTVSLTVTSTNGCAVTKTRQLSVNGTVPRANFTVVNPGGLCSNTNVQIQDQSNVQDFGVITRIEIYWDFVNAPTVFNAYVNPAPAQLYNHLYPNFQTPLTKTYTIKLRAFSGGTCVNEKVQTITVNATPKVSFTALADTCLYISPFQITQASEVGGVPGTGAYSGTGVSTSGLFDPSVAGVGPHMIRYTYTSNKGCVDYQEQTINISEPPVAKFGYSSPQCATNDITFFDSSTATAGAITKWTWNFGDGTAPVVRTTGASFTHAFGSALIYNVTLTVFTDAGCNSTAYTLPVKVNALPVPGFLMPKVCLPGGQAMFTDSSRISDGTAGQFSYLWDFGDAASGVLNSDTVKNPIHVYSAVGPYSVRLTVTSSSGCVRDTVQVYNDIHPQPHASFVADPLFVCAGGTIGFNSSQSNGMDGSIVTYNWRFGDGGTDNRSNPPHVFNNVGNFSVQLYEVNSQGCTSDTARQAVTVYAYPVVNGGGNVSVLQGGTVQLHATASGTQLQYLWTPPTNISNTTTLTPVVTGGADDQTYKLTVTGQGGCTSLAYVLVKVLKFPVIPNTFTPNGDGINDLWVIDHLDNYPDCHVEIFNRYGQLVFESKGYGKPWNGTMNGKAVPWGTYYYIIEPGSGRKPVTGYVTIIK